jgi:hypothetical protein
MHRYRYQAAWPGPAGPTGPTGSAGEPLFSGAEILVNPGTPVPSGFTKVGTFTFKIQGAKKNQTSTVTFDVLRKNWFVFGGLGVRFLATPEPVSRF